jgi:hypothetical protein
MNEADPAWPLIEAITRPALAIAPPTFLNDLRASLTAEVTQDAMPRPNAARS